MFARVSTYRVTADSIAESDRRSADPLKDPVKKAEALSGFKGLYYLVDQASGKAISVTLWNTEHDMRQSEEVANQIRTDDATATGTQIVSVEHYEVTTAELR